MASVPEQLLEAVVELDNGKEKRLKRADTADKMKSEDAREAADELKKKCRGSDEDVKMDLQRIQAEQMNGNEVNVIKAIVHPKM